jgi:AAT family amino acid transporter
MTMSSQSQDLSGDGDLARKLKSRHIHMIAIGGAIGVGLFLGSGKAISMAGPGLLLSYAVGGIAVFFIMRALGELLMHKPVAGSFATYAEEYVGPFAGFATGWSYWFMWVVIGMAEITAVGVYIHYWLPNVPQWVPAMVTLAVLYIVNVVAVRMFGELEFWFALIKVVTIVALILGGLAVIVFRIGELGQQASFSNLWTHGGFLPFGALGAVLALQMVMFAYQGVELIGVTAGEAENPEEVLPRATNGIIWRILIFYLGALAVIMALLPWNQLDPNTSPFVFVFDKLGLSIAADVINFVVITAAASSCNSGIFSNGRMLFTLARAGQAPRIFGKVSRNHVPFYGITASTAVMSLGVLLNYVVPEQAFIWITSISLVGSLWTWSIIMIAHLGYRRAVARGEAKPVHFRMPGAPVANWLVVAFLLMVAVFLGFDPSTRVALYVAPIWFGLLAIAYQVTKRQRVSALTAT